jgi:hypothetical protein
MQTATFFGGRLDGCRLVFHGAPLPDQLVADGDCYVRRGERYVEATLSRSWARWLLRDSLATISSAVRRRTRPTPPWRPRGLERLLAEEEDSGL